MRETFGISTGLLLSGSITAVTFGYLVRFLALSFGTVEASLGKITPSMDGAARSLGHGAVSTLRRVHLPLIRGSVLTAAMLVFVAGRAFTWRHYLHELLSGGAPAGARAVLARLRPWMAGLGVAAPALLAAAGALLPSAAAGLFALAGAAVIASGWLFKYSLVTRAAFNQGFALQRTPTHGAGPPGPGVRPGWQ